MCGICGFTGSRRDNVLANMNHSILHRGPDESASVCFDEVSLAMRRLAIVDIASGQQPVYSEDKDICVVFNGEIYDFRSHRKFLEERGHRFRSDHSDTEVIVHLYEEFGEEWVTRVNGMLSVALWDAKAKKLLLYRDRLGKKPLYYALCEGRLVFGSEIKSILAFPGISHEPDMAALYSYFGLKNTSAPRTAFAAVRQVMPGSLLAFQDGQISERSYWRVDMSRIRHDLTLEEAAERLLVLLDDAVRLRMDCDAPYGAYLSGGVDSSSVAALMSRYCKQGLKTFCLGYDEPATGQFAGKKNDIDFARLMSHRLQTAHFEHLLSPQEFSDGMPGMIRAFDEPFSGTCSTYFLTPLIRSHVKVALSGDGADELFGSYLAHRIAFPLANLRQLLGKGLTRWVELGTEERDSLKPFDTAEGFAYLLSMCGSSNWSWREQLCVFTTAQRCQLLRPEILECAGRLDQDQPYAEIEKSLTGDCPLNCTLEWDQRELLANQVLPFVDRLSMAFSVEVRSPYLDYRVVEYANSLPGWMKIHQGMTKYVHKQAMASLLPSDMLARPKEGFVQPNYSWMHGPLRDWTLQQMRALPAAWFRQECLAELTAHFLAGEQEYNARIWNLVCFSLWYNQYQR